MKVGLLLSGCGMYDGTEAMEASLALLALDRSGVQAVCLAPEAPQMHVVDHLTGEEAEGEARSILKEAARLVRGKVAALEGFWGGDLQGLIIPGGYGAPKNLVTGFMRLGEDRQVLPQVRDLLDDLVARRRPIGAISLGRAVLAAYLGEAMSEDELQMAATETATDEPRRILFTPGFLTAARISEAARGIDALVAGLLRLAAPPLAVIDRGGP